MDLIDDFVWENFKLWDGSDHCYKKLKKCIEASVQKCAKSKLRSYAQAREQEHVFVRDKLYAMRQSSKCPDAFDKFIAQRNQLRHLYVIVGAWLCL